MNKKKEIAGACISILQGKNVDVSDWQALVDYALEIKLFPPLFSRLREQKSGGTLQEVIFKYKSLNLANLMLTLKLEKELGRVLVCFREKSIQAMVLKGLLFARVIYNDLALRQVPVDLDLLVGSGQFAQAHKVLLDAGYVCEETVIGKKRADCKLHYSGQLSFNRIEKDGSIYRIELHRDIRGIFVYSQELDIWQGASESTADGVPLLVPTPENMLIYLCLLLMSVSEFIEVRYIYDLHSFLRKFNTNLDWHKVHEKLTGSRHSACAYFALTISQTLFDSPVPCSFLKKIKPSVIKRGVLSLWLTKNNILTVGRGENRRWYYLFTGWHYFVSSYLYSRNIVDCIGIIVRKIFPPAEEIALLYNNVSEPVYWIYIKRLLKPVRHMFR